MALLADVGRRPCRAIGPPGISPVRFSGCRGLVFPAEGGLGGLPISQRFAFGPFGPAGGRGAACRLACVAGTRPWQVGFSRGLFLRRDKLPGLLDGAASVARLGRGRFGGGRYALYALPKPAKRRDRFSLCRA